MSTLQHRAIPRFCLITATMLFAAPGQTAELTSWLELQAKAEFGWVQHSEQNNNLGPWWQHGTGQLAISDDRLTTGPILAALQINTDSPFSARLHLSQQAALDAASGITEAWLQYQPLPIDGYRLKARAGWFYPALSLENTDIVWSSPYTSTFSAINSWYAEELRAKTLELSLSRPGRSFASNHSWQGVLGAFRDNDPLGTLISWRGFAVHNLQTRIGGRVDFAHYPSLRRFPLDLQPDWVEPFAELDGHTGWYGGLHYLYQQDTEIRFYHYDNQADPTVFVKGQYAWLNRFNQLALQQQLSERWRLVSQWLDGHTEMGYETVLVDYRAAFVLLNYQHDLWQASVRYDHWQQWDRDQTAGDDNSGRGHNWTVALQYPLSAQWTLLGEFSRLNSHQASRGQWANWPLQRNFYQSQLSLIWRFD
ncbi:MAG: hypothetical protein U5L02_12315 [Rheinheimera sp.]|nr:hypothetical protein [Rheinheimera sp.]